MKQCPKCDSPRCAYRPFLAKYKCCDCGHIETDKEKEIRMAKSMGLVFVEEFNKLQNLVKRLKKQVETLIKATKTEPRDKKGNS